MSLFDQVTGQYGRTEFIRTLPHEEVVDMPVFDHGVWLPQHDNPIMYSFFTREPGSYAMYKEANADAHGLPIPRRMAVEKIQLIIRSDSPERSIKAASQIDRFQFIIMDKVYYEADLKLSPFMVLPSSLHGVKIMCCELEIDHWLPIPPNCRFKAELYFKIGVAASDLVGVDFVCFLKGPLFRPIC